MKPERKGIELNEEEKNLIKFIKNNSPCRIIISKIRIRPCQTKNGIKRLRV